MWEPKHIFKILWGPWPPWPPWFWSLCHAVSKGLIQRSLLTPTWYDSNNTLQTYNSKLYIVTSSISVQSTNSLNNVPVSVRWNHQEERWPRAMVKWNGTLDSSSYLYISLISFWSQKLNWLLFSIFFTRSTGKEAFNIIYGSYN